MAADGLVGHAAFEDCGRAHSGRNSSVSLAVSAHGLFLYMYVCM